MESPKSLKVHHWLSEINIILESEMCVSPHLHLSLPSATRLFKGVIADETRETGNKLPIERRRSGELPRLSGVCISASYFHILLLMEEIPKANHLGCIINLVNNNGRSYLMRQDFFHRQSDIDIVYVVYNGMM